MGPFQLSQASEHERKILLLSKFCLPYCPGQEEAQVGTLAQRSVLGRQAEGSCATAILKRTKNGVYYHCILQGSKGNPEFKSSLQVTESPVY